ncbi:acyl-ACP--UDP-N-acetylglucosamine O-acyltransferase [uncultured Thiothrix sp.]|uniref:acyl-ACP--UDP-N-acetylglucosamine O-acyltransferase n=1 Tax=uncultured Thiothrix sp. TaxID=223185 RepID=UPI00262B96B5|nr:acyl-ACP--UDP-N-acetylglucosamine O-acyltransferase [uncultured Thiothrix sp.]HMT92228.1 acyl-ACP--UDP-N-acetylglucosamine O-acyltransferase [Thiolinea sp.]
MIHPTALIHPSAQLAADVEVGAYSIIGEQVSIGRGTRIASHVVIEGPTRMGEDNHIFQFASVGAIPQDKKYKGEPTELIIGDRNVIRESCTLNRGTAQDKGKTVIGSDNWIMAYVHIAHDCIVGNHTVFANSATLAGHVVICDYAILGGFTLVHQFCTVGEYAFTGMGSAIGKDVPPYTMVNGAPAIPRGINAEGLKRNGFSSEAIQRIKDSYRLLYRQQITVKEALAQLEADYGEFEDIQRLIQFVQASQRGLIR